MTYGDVLNVYRRRPEYKSTATDGSPCSRRTTGLLQRRAVQAIIPIEHIGKEANLLDQIAAGITTTDDETTIYKDPAHDDWNEAFLPLLRQVAPSQGLALVDSFFRVGSLTFGGGHVVLPLLSSELVPRGKPHPDIFLYAAQAMDVDACECLVIEDSVGGVQAGVAARIVAVAEAKTVANAALGTAGMVSFFVKGILCNWLVCLGVVMAMTSTSTVGKIAATWLPIFTFFALGFEHAVVNMFIIPTGMLLGAKVSVYDWWVWNQIPVTLGNLVGGFVFTGLALYTTFKPTQQAAAAPTVVMQVAAE